MADRVSDIYARARADHKAGRLERAKQGYLRLIQRAPEHAPTIQFLGLIAHQQGEHERAVDLIGKAIELDDSQPLYFNNLGIALRTLGRHDESASAFRRAIELKSDYAGALYNLGAQLLDTGHVDEAERLLSRAIEAKPEFTDALTHLARLRLAFGDLDKAVEDLRKAVKVDPDHQLALMLLGNTLLALGARRPARACFRRVVKSKPDAAAAWLSLASIEDDENSYQNALEAYRYAAGVNPDYKAKVVCHLALLFLKACDWDLYEEREAEFVRLVESHIESNAIEDLSPLSLNYFGIETGLRLRAAKHRADLATRNVSISLGRCHFDHARSTPAKLRVGYVSPDFRSHAVGTLVRDLFAHHDRSKFEVFAYSLVSRDDDVNLDIRAGVDSYREIARSSPEAAARTIYEDDIHILIDLAGYTTHSKTEMFALKPAPVQCHYMGYLDTMGADFLPYMVADRQVVTSDMAEQFSEAIVYMPISFFVTSRMPVSGRRYTRSEIGLPDDAFVFCCMNNQRKINPEVFDAWMQILEATPEAVLWLHDRDDVGASANLKSAAESRGIAADRLIVSGPESHPDYMARYALADLFLDTFVYSAGATGVGALAAGVPMLTRPGGTMLNRMGSSLVIAAGLPELVAASTDEYIRKAVELASKRHEVERMKTYLRDERSSIALFDTKRWVGNFEKALELMWQDFETGRGPQSHDVGQQPVPNNQ